MDAEPPAIIAPAPAPSATAPTPPAAPTAPSSAGVAEPAPATAPAASAPPSSEPAPAAPELPATPPPTAAAAPARPAPASTTTVVATRDVLPAAPPGPLEIGAGGFLLSGGPAGGYAGATVFLMSDWGKSVFVRPSLMLGQSTGTVVQSTLGSARVDTCARIEGNYAKGGGIQLDVCGGVEGGYASLSQGPRPGEPVASDGKPLLQLGPSVGLHAELGTLAITLRGVAGYEVTQSSYLDNTGARVSSPAVPFRVELALSWDLHGESAAPPSVETIARR